MEGLRIARLLAKIYLRPEGGKIKQLAEKGKITSLAVLTVDRLGRNTLDILQSVKFFTDRKICIEFLSQGIRTLNEDGTENHIGNMILSIMGTLAQMERSQIRERQTQGIELAKTRGVYKGRKTGSKESTLDFLSKESNKEALQMMKRGLKATEIAKLTGLNKNTLSKIKRLGLTATA